MAESATSVIEQPAQVADPGEQVPAATGGEAPDAADALVADDLLVEEISIDGMCGVY